MRCRDVDKSAYGMSGGQEEERVIPDLSTAKGEFSPSIHRVIHRVIHQKDLADWRISLFKLFFCMGRVDYRVCEKVERLSGVRIAGREDHRA